MPARTIFALTAAALAAVVGRQAPVRADTPRPAPTQPGPRAPVDDSAMLPDEAPEDGIPVAPPSPPPRPVASPDGSPTARVSRGIGVTAHAIRARIEAGTVWVTETLRIRGERAGSRAGHVRIPVTSGAVPVGASPSGASVVLDSGDLVVRPGALRGGEERIVVVTWIARARRVGASWRWSLAARPEHMRMAEPELSAPGLEVEESPEGGWLVRAPVLDAASVLHARGRDVRSTSVTIALQPAPIPPRDVVAALDASVSMDASRRLRALQAVWSIADALPRGSTVRTMMYGATAEALDTEARAPDAGDGRFAARRIAAARLGAVTRPAAALALAREWAASRASVATLRAPTLLVLLTDGGVYAGEGEIDTLRQAAARLEGTEVAVIDLARSPNDEPSAELARIVAATGGAYVSVGHLEDEDVGPEARRILAPLRAGAGSIWIDGQRLRTPPLRAGDTWSARVDRPANEALGRFEAGPIGRVLPAIRASLARIPSAGGRRPLASLPPEPGSSARRVEASTSIPQDVLRDALRSSLLGPARRCFRADRAGRRRYAAHVRIDLLIAEGELHSVRVTAQTPERAAAGNAGPSADLLSCLARAATALDIPRANVWLEVRYPLVVRPEAPDTVHPLSPSTTEALDRVLGDTDPDELLRRPAP
ncbi:MAG: VWA domain-containing protein [Deltaproteobacteria bacterium]|nr:VWA domain-containing protein [Deltaproteobacteria bacterium]